MQNRLIPVATAILYALGYPLGALTLGHFSPFLLIVIRFVLSALILWPIVLVRRTALPRGRTLAIAILAGCLVQGVQFMGGYWGLSHGVGAGVTALLIAMNPMATSILGRLALGRRENRWGLAALGAGFAAVLVACLPRILADPAIGLGVIAVVIGLLGLSSGSLIQGQALVGVDPFAFTAIGVTASIPLAGALALAQPERLTDPVPGFALLLALVVASTIGLVGYAWCVRRFGPSGASVMFAVIPAIASLGGWVLQGTPIDLTAGVALLLGAVACAFRARAGRPTHRGPSGQRHSQVEGLASAYSSPIAGGPDDAKTRRPPRDADR